MQSKVPSPNTQDVLSRAIRSGDLTRYHPEDPGTHPYFDERIHLLSWKEVGDMQDLIHNLCERILKDIVTEKRRRRTANPGTPKKSASRQIVRGLKRDLYVLHHLEQDLEEVIQRRLVTAVTQKISLFEMDEKGLENFVDRSNDPLKSLFIEFCGKWVKDPHVESQN